MATKDLVEKLKTMILVGRFPEQSKLPPERVLAKELKVTRTSLRKALALLEAQGEIWRHVGKGTFVGSPPIEETLELSFLKRSTNPMEIMEMRLVIERKLRKFGGQV